MVTERLAKHCCKNIFLWERGRAGPWSSAFGGLMHTEMHTNTLSCAAGAGLLLRVVEGEHRAGCEHLPAVIKRGDPGWQVPSTRLICAELTRRRRPYHPPAGSLSLLSRAGRDSKGIWSPPHHPPMARRALPPCASPSVSFWALGSSGLLCRGLLCEARMCFQSFTPSSWVSAGCCAAPALCSVPWLWAEASPLCIQQLSRDPPWTSVSPRLWNILSWKGHRGVAPHL